MQVVQKPDTDVCATVAYAMRHSGATLQQIGDALNLTKERIRQILIEHFGSSRHPLLSTEQLRSRLNLSRPRIMELYRAKVITPEKRWVTGDICHLLWSPEAVKKVNNYLDTGRFCKRCGCPLPRGRRVFCSNECYQEDHKYRYKSDIAKKKHLESVRRYRQRQKVAVHAAAVK